MSNYKWIPINLLMLGSIVLSMIVLYLQIVPNPRLLEREEISFLRELIDQSKVICIYTVFMWDLYQRC